MFGASKDHLEFQMFREGISAPAGNHITTNPYPPPYQQPQDLDRYAGETNEMRIAYYKFHATEPAFQAAIDGKVAAIASLDVSVLPPDEDSAADKRAAEFIRDAVENAPGGWSGLITKILQPAFLSGFSVTEKWYAGVADEQYFVRIRPKWRGFWAPRRYASIDTQYLRVQLNDTRELIGIVNTRRGLEGYTPERVIFYTNRKIFENPYGRSDGRSVYRACQLIDNAFKLWYIAMKNYSAPFLTAKTKSQGKIRAAFETALQNARAGGYILCADEDVVEVLNLASATSFQAFKENIDKARQEVYLGVRGAFLPFLEGMQQDARGDTKIHKTASDAIEYLLVQGVCEVINHQVIPDLVIANFGEQCGIPTMTLGGTDWAETKAQLDVADILVNKFRIPVSKKSLYKVSQMEPPRDNDDEAGPAPLPPPPPAPPQNPPGGGMGGLGFNQQFGNVPGQNQPIQFVVLPIQQSGAGVQQPAAFPVSDRVNFDGGPPGPPPHPGLIWRESTHRWVLPDSNEGGGNYKPQNKPSEDAVQNAHKMIQENHANPHMKAVHEAFVSAATGSLDPEHIINAADAMKNLNMHQLRALKTFYGVGGTTSNKNPMVDNILAAVKGQGAVAPKPKPVEEPAAPEPAKAPEKKPVTPQLPPPAPKPPEKKEPKPDQIDHMPEAKPETTVVKTGIGGSTGAVQVKDADGNLYVKKDASSGKGGKAQLMSEENCNAMYRAAGVIVPASKYYGDEKNGEKLGRWVQGETLQQYESKASSAEKEEIHKEIQKGFIYDALFANYDAIGLSKDNIVIDKDGKAFRIDNGGSLTFRAQGGKKPFGDTVEELNSLRNPSINPSAASVYGSLTDKQIAENIKYQLSTKITSILNAAPKDLKATLEKRINYMQDWATNILEKPKDKPAPKPEPKKEPNLSPNVKAQPHDNVAMPKDFIMGYVNKGNIEVPDESRPAISTDAANGLNNYSGTDYRKMNNALREGKKLTGELGKQTEAIREAFKNAKPFSKPVMLYRGLKDQAGTDAILKSIGEALMHGKNAVLKGFISTSTSNPFATSWGHKAKIEIEAVHGLDMRPYSGIKSEDEVLLDHDSQYEVVSYDSKGHNGKPLVKLKQIPPKSQ